MNRPSEPAELRMSNTALIMSTSAALLTLAPVAAHQLRLLAHLPDPPGCLFASDEITGSKAAHPLGIPDSLLGLSSYAVTLALAVAAPTHKEVRRVLGIKLLADGSAAGFNVVRQCVSFRRICSWCTATAICTAMMVVAGRAFILEGVASACDAVSFPGYGKTLHQSRGDD